MAPPTSATTTPPPSSDPASCPFTRVAQQGELVRKLKAEQAPKVWDHVHIWLLSPHVHHQSFIGTFMFFHHFPCPPLLPSEFWCQESVFLVTSSSCLMWIVQLPFVTYSFAWKSSLDVKYPLQSNIYQWYQEQIDAAVKQLLALKAEFKKITGQDYKPGMATPAAPAPAPMKTSSTPPSSSASLDPYERVAQQGEVVRKLKSEKAPKVFRWNARGLLSFTKLTLVLIMVTDREMHASELYH